jgi:Protein of unknown function (DUF3303)
MLYMIIERFRTGKVKELYKRFEEKGRMLPEGVNYINSWINEEITICYQVMESDAEDKLHEWMSRWSDLADFEMISVLTSAEARKKIFTS